MNRRLLIPLVAVGLALGSGVASANPTYWRDNGLLLEVSADPRDGNDFVQVHPRYADSLDLIALHARVDLRGIVVRFASGRAFHTHVNGVWPGQPLRIHLPPRRSPIVSVELAYIRPEWRRWDRTPARLQIVAHSHHDRRDDHDHYEPSYRPYDRQPYQDPGYRSRPQRRSGLGGYVEGGFRF